VVIVDTGTLEDWCHDDVPSMGDGSGPEEFVRNANLAREFALRGPDAERVGQLLNRSPNPEIVFDVGPDFEAQLRGEVEQVRSKYGLDATLEPLPGRITHANRVREVLARNPGGGPFRFQNIDCVVASGMPEAAELEVVGWRLADRPEGEEWSHVSLECRPELITQTSIQLGLVAVDWARLMFADFEALAHWRHNDSRDGLADVAFWGADGDAVAKATGAGWLADGTWGWEDGPEAELAEVFLKLENLRSQGRYRFACDFRPHSHHYALLKQMRVSGTGSGSTVVGNARFCAFMTGCGDGFFPVFKDVDAFGQLVRIRICFQTTGEL
jgi:hypothetical protein